MMALRNGEPFLLFLKIDVVIDAPWQFVFVMCDIDECAVGIVIHITVDDSLYQIAVA